MFLAILVVLALAETYRRTRHRLRALWPRLQSDWSELRTDVRAALRRVPRWEWLTLGAITGVAFVVRWAPLFQPIRYDEAATWIDYASQPLARALADYRFPNNHLFHTLLVHVSAALFGDEPWALRVPAFAAGIALVPLVWAVGRAVYSQSAGLIAAALAATSASLVLYSTNARGYTMLACLTLIVALIAVRLPRRENVASWAALAFAAALGLWTIPVMLYPLAGIALWLWAEARAGDTVIPPRMMLERLRWTSVAIFAMTALLYLPVVYRSGIALVIGNRFVRPQSRRSFFAGLPSFYHDIWSDWTRGWPWWLAAMVGVGMVAATVLRGARARRSVSLAGAAIVAATLLLLANGRIPYVRVWLYLLPLVLVAAAGGLVHGWRKLALVVAPLRGRQAGALALGAALALVVTGGALGTVLSRVVWYADDTGVFPEAQEVASELLARAGRGDRVVVTAPSDLPLEYYLGVSRRGRALLEATPDSAQHIWIVVNERERQDVNAIVRRAEIMTIDFSPPRQRWRGADVRLFVLDRERPGCVLAPERCR
jgi:hypothetical protein